MVIATLDALAAMDYPAFDVLLIDNNTPSPTTWQPVAEHVASLGSRFRFIHRDGVEGAKAGALNIALQETHEAARFVAVIDADYQVSPDFLTRAVEAARESGADFVQFPQAYRGVGSARSVERELRAYFEQYPAAANASGAPLLTGTLSLIERRALEAAGGWPTSTITEDAELGVRLWELGMNGRYVDRIVGRGLLPVDFAGLRTQRQRWVAGNVQSLLGLLQRGARGRGGSAAVVAQLTAWPSFIAIPLLAFAWLALAGPGVELAGALMAVSSATLIATCLGLVFRALALRSPSVLVVKSALLWTSSLGWWPVMWGKRLQFRRTPKSAGSRGSVWNVESMGSALALLLAAVLAAQGWWLPAALTLLCSAGLITVPLVDRSLRQAAVA